MECYPRCDLPLPEIGNARVTTNFNVCAQPAEFSVRIIHEVRSMSTFLVGGKQVDSRKIGTEHWPLKLNVQFYENSNEEYFVKACVVTERTNHVSCFMNSTYSREFLFDQCDTTRSEDSSLPVVLLTGLLAIMFLIISIGMIFFIQRVFLRFTNARNGRAKFHKKSQCTALLPSIHTQKFSIEEDRLTVIEEEKEEVSRLSPSASSSGFESEPICPSKVSSLFTNDLHTCTIPLPTMVSTTQCALQSFRPAAYEV